MDAVAHMVGRLTRESARFFGLETGTMEIGDGADLVLVDPAALRSWDPETTVERIHRDVFETEQLVNRPPGVVRGVWIRGRQIFDGEAFADDFQRAAYGRLLRPVNHWPVVDPVDARAA
jgi:N-acyl-D-aspartate/D-glutamate deacylase